MPVKAKKLSKNRKACVIEEANSSNAIRANALAVVCHDEVAALRSQ
jgi:hypothetical protein